MSIKKLVVTENSKEINLENDVEENLNNSIENSCYKIEISNGEINVLDKKKNKWLKDCLHIEESGDDGDTYDYSPPKTDVRNKLKFSDATYSVTKGDLYSLLKINVNYLLPKNLEEREKNINSVATKVRIKISLDQSNLIDFHLEIDNEADDHRMRIVFSSGITSETSLSDTPFGTIVRENTSEHIENWREIGWREEPTPINPMIRFASLKDHCNQVVVFSKGIKEFEILNNSQIALTLFRGVGFLGKPDLINRPGIASGNEFKYIETPKSQLHKTLKFKFSILLENVMDNSYISEVWQKYAVGVPNYQVQEINKFTNTLKYFVMHPLKNTVETLNNLVNCDNIHNIEVKGILPVNQKEYTIRFLNCGEEANENGFISVANCKNYTWVNLKNDNVSETYKGEDKIFLGKFKQGEIRTLKIEIY